MNQVNERAMYLGLPRNTELSNDMSVSGIFCPRCTLAMEFFTVYGPGVDGQGRNRRVYYGHCKNCKKTIEVHQFEYMGVWVINQYKSDSDIDWNRLHVPLVEPAIPTTCISKNEPFVKTGPGGDYLNDITDEDLQQLFKNATLIYNKVGHFLSELLDIVKRKKQHG